MLVCYMSSMQLEACDNSNLQLRCSLTEPLELLVAEQVFCVCIHSTEHIMVD